MPDDIRNLADTVARAAARNPDGAALIVGSASITWTELNQRVDAVAAAFRRLDLQRDDQAAPRVAIVLPNVPEFAAALFGTLRAGLVAVPINPGYTARELRHQLDDSGASILIATAEVATAIADVQLAGLRHRYVVGNATSPGTQPYADLTHPVDPVTAEAGGEDLAVLLYTSGTAGAPKGAMLSHRALIANHRQVERITPPIVAPGDTVLLALPLFHAFGLNSGLGAIAWHGACGVLLDRFDPAESLDAIARHGVTVVTAVPPMYAAWAGLPGVRDAVRSVRVLISGAAPLTAGVAHRFLDASGRAISEGYGLTETAPVVATALASPEPKVGSIGRPIPEVEVRLVSGDGLIALVTPDGLVDGDADDFDDDAGGVPGTDPGEIVVRGPNLFSGYWPSGAGGPDADGWWPTGDVAYADADGDLFLVDRLGDLILVSGFNVYPHEIELVLASHPGVAEAAVMAMESEQTGQAVRAYVVPVEPVTVADLMTHCERNLARFKCPSVIEFVSELPHSATGKVRKGQIGVDSADQRGAAR